MTRVAGAHRERFLPYRYVRNGIGLVIASYTLDGKSEVNASLDGHLVELSLPWAHATFVLTVTVPSATHAAVAGGAPVSAFEVTIITRCPSTFLRVAQRVPLSALEEPIEVHLDLQRDDLAGSAEVMAFLVRTSDTPGHLHAAVRGARLADSPSWELRVDRQREPRGEYLDIRYKKFSSDESIPRRDRGNLYVLDLDQPDPILWVNADHERVTAILDSRGTVGRHARLRESFFDHIAYAVWTQLFLKAAHDYTQDGEATYPWQDAVLDLLLRDVFPNHRTQSDRREHLRDVIGEPTTLMRSLDAGLQRRNDLAAHLTKLVSEEEGT